MKDYRSVVDAALKSADPYSNVADILSGRYYENNVMLVAVGKAAYTMAKAAYDVLCSKIVRGYILTKYGHGNDPFSSVFTVREAGHPVPDENSVKYTAEIINAVKELGKNDKLLFLLSGGASALFEYPLVSLELLQSMTDKLLKSSAEITEINTIRKRLSAVKGGKFALMCDCEIDCIVLSDVLGDRLDMIASGPCIADSSDVRDVLDILKKYKIEISADTPEGIEMQRYLFAETPKNIINVDSVIAGNIEMLCNGAAKEAKKSGYHVIIKTLEMIGEASVNAIEICKNAINFAAEPHKKTAFIYGGETTVTVKGHGKGGRNQEMALCAAIELKDTTGIEFLSFGSDGTDGPTDAAGGFVDGNSYSQMLRKGILPEKYLLENDSYNALNAIDSLVFTGPTGTNVNDVTIVFVN